MDVANEIRPLMNNKEVVCRGNPFTISRDHTKWSRDTVSPVSDPSHRIAQVDFLALKA
jgi:hypothetical protein